MRFKPNRITITLKKWLETSWKELTRKETGKSGGSSAKNWSDRGPK